MRRIVSAKKLYLLLLLVLFVLAGCSQMSLFNLVESEQEGEFSLGLESVNLKVDSEFNFSSVGGFLPYTYAVNDGVDTGAIDPGTGIYTAPGTAGEATVESSDGIGHWDSARVFIFEAITADPASFSLRLDDPDHLEQDILLSGGTGSFTAVAENENAVVNPATFSTTPYTVTYSPGDPGTDYINVFDERGNSLAIKVEVLPASSDIVLEILPDEAVLAPGETQTFNITNTNGNINLSITLLGDEPYGTIEISDGQTSVDYTAPGEVTSVFLKVYNNDTGDSVQADIGVQEGLTPLQITPGSVEVSPGTTVEFTASGGKMPYTFEQVTGTGTLVKTSPATVEYTPESVSSIFKVIDDAGDQAMVRIKVK